MASKKEYLEYVLEQLSGLEDITFKAMMGSSYSITKAGYSAGYTMTGCW